MPQPLSTLACLCAVASSAAEQPAPVFHVSFDDGFGESLAGGEAQVEVFIEGQGPYLMPGPWGDCLDMTASSRFGGTLSDTEPAGSAVIHRSAALNALSSFTVALWLRGAAGAPETSSRILTKFGSWELMYAKGRPSLLTVWGDEKKGYRCPATTVDPAQEWTFVAASVDREGASVSLFVGTRDGGLADPATYELDHLPAIRESALQVGNYNGIRPFKGWMDNLRVFDAALSPGQVRALFDADVGEWSGGSLVCELGVPVRQGRFRMKQSDVPFRVLSQKRLDSLNGWDMMEATHATHLLWVYGADPAYVERAHAAGLFYQASQNGLCGYDKATPKPGAEDDTTGRQQNLDGNKFVLPHMAKWTPENPRWTGCHNNPDFRKLFFAQADSFVKLGVDSLHVDDWMMTYTTARSGLGCFCPACLAGFRQYLGESLTVAELRDLGIEEIATFDYRAHLGGALGIGNQEQYRKRFRDLPLTKHFLAFQAEGLRDFYRAYRKRLDTVSPDKYLPISVNNQACRREVDGGFRGMFMADLLDFFQGEASRSMQTSNHFLMPCKVAEALDIPQIMMSKPGPLAASQAALATSYALGQWFRVPWDLYMDNDANGQAAPRYMGKLEDWGPLYDFVHDHPTLFDGYQTAATVGVLFNLDEAPYETVWNTCARLAGQQIQFRLFAGTAAGDQPSLSPKALERVRLLVQLHSTATFGEADRAVIEAAQASRRVRFLEPDDDLDSHLRDAERDLIRVEGPENVFAFLRVNPDAKCAAIHLVNWRHRPDETVDPFGNVTVSLRHPKRWGATPTFTWHAPGQAEGLVLQPEVHRDVLRITVPRLEVWGVLEVNSRGDAA